MVLKSTPAVEPSLNLDGTPQFHYAIFVYLLLTLEVRSFPLFDVILGIRKRRKSMAKA